MTELLNSLSLLLRCKEVLVNTYMLVQEAVDFFDTFVGFLDALRTASIVLREGWPFFFFLYMVADLSQIKHLNLKTQKQ